MKSGKSLLRKLRTLAGSGIRTLRDRRGDLSTNTIGGIILGVVVIGILITAVNAFFPGFFGDMFDSMSEKLSANW